MIKQRNVDNRDPLKMQRYETMLGTVSATITALPFHISSSRFVIPSVQFFYTAASASGSVRIQISDGSTLVYDSGVVATTGTAGNVAEALNTLNSAITYVPPSDSALGALPLVNQADILTVTVTPVTATYTNFQMRMAAEGA